MCLRLRARLRCLRYCCELSRWAPFAKKRSDLGSIGRSSFGSITGVNPPPVSSTVGTGNWVTVVVTGGMNCTRCRCAAAWDLVNCGAEIVIAGVIDGASVVTGTGTGTGTGMIGAAGNCSGINIGAGACGSGGCCCCGGGGGGNGGSIGSAGTSA